MPTAAALPRPPPAQPAPGRAGEVHRLRAVRVGLPGRRDLRRGRRQHRRTSSFSPGRALRPRLPDQLPALHLLRPVHRGLPDPGADDDQRVRAGRADARRPDLREAGPARPDAARACSPAPHPMVPGTTDTDYYRGEVTGAVPTSRRVGREHRSRRARGRRPRRPAGTPAGGETATPGTARDGEAGDAAAGAGPCRRRVAAGAVDRLDDRQRRGGPVLGARAAHGPRRARPAVRAKAVHAALCMALGDDQPRHPLRRPGGAVPRRRADRSSTPARS